MITRSTHGMRHSNISRAETRSIHLKGWSETVGEGSLGRQPFHTRIRWSMNFKVARRYLPWFRNRDTSGKVTHRIIPLSGKKNYFWFRDHCNSLYQPKAITTIVWRNTKGWHTRTRMDDVNYLVEGNAMDDFACTCSQELEHFHIHQGFTNIRGTDPGNTTYYHDD